MSKIKKLAAIALSACMLGSVGFIAACGDGDDPNPGPDGGETTLKTGTYRTYTTVLPSNWNELTYSDNNDTQILNYIVSPFFEYDYQFEDDKKFNEDGTVNYDGIVDGGYTVKYSAATALEDVTSEVDAKWGYTAADKQTGGYAWKITLREDLTWDDGTPIDANDFVYTMKQQLDPLFKNLRASTYYNNIQIKNARNYVYSLDEYTYVTLSSAGYASLDAALAEEKVYLNMWEFYGLRGAQSVTYNEETGEFTVNPNSACPEWVDVTDNTLWLDPVYYDDLEAYEADKESLDAAYEKALEQYEKDYAAWEAAVEAGTATEDDEPAAPTDPEPHMEDYVVSAAGIFGLYKPYFDVGMPYNSYVGVQRENTAQGTSFDSVGIYAPSDYEIVVCLDAPIQCLNEDGSLSYEAAYSFSGLPLVKEDLYEKCKQAPQAGSTLWTTNYNTSLETSASWGPYKLTQFQRGNSYTLSRNDEWYGYDLEDNANQYNVTAINCSVIANLNTQWMSFLSGEIDDIGLDVTHKEQYRNSKYTMYAPGTGTFGINVYSNVNVLNTSGRNNSILAIEDFRKAMSLGLNRDDYNQTCYTSHRTCLGIMGPSYYYDIANAQTLEDNGVYRNTKYAKEALLRVYGFTEQENGTWTSGVGEDVVTYRDYEEAYAAITGYDIDQARVLVDQAYDYLVAHSVTNENNIDENHPYVYDPNKQIEIKFGTSEDNENTRRQYDYIVDYIENLIDGTKLEGKITVTFDASFGSSWADDFKNGSYDLAPGTGFSGGAFDPAGFLQCYVDPDAGLMYSTWWDTEAEMMTYTMPKDTELSDAENAALGLGEELTMSVYNWYCCLNGLAGGYGQEYTYNWGSGFVSESVRLELLAKLEELILEKYYTIVTTSEYSATVYGAKFTNASEEYNIFMGFGGMRYLTVNYTDSEWDAYVDSLGGNLESLYTQTN